MSRGVCGWKISVSCWETRSPSGARDVVYRSVKLGRDQLALRETLPFARAAGCSILVECSGVQAEMASQAMVAEPSWRRLAAVFGKLAFPGGGKCREPSGCILLLNMCILQKPHSHVSACIFQKLKSKFTLNNFLSSLQCCLHCASDEEWAPLLFFCLPSPNRHQATGEGWAGADSLQHRSCLSSPTGRGKQGEHFLLAVSLTKIRMRDGLGSKSSVL